MRRVGDVIEEDYPCRSYETSLKALDSERAATEISLAAFDKAIRTRIAYRTRLRNRLAPIHRLPNELFILIIKDVLGLEDGRRGKDYLPLMMYGLRAVTSSWRYTINHTPELWTHIHASDGPSFLGKAVARSDDSPLHLVHDSPWPDVMWRMETSGFATRIQKHAHRWKSLTLKMVPIEVIESACKSSAPLLESLRVSVPPITFIPYPGQARIDAFLERITSLKELRIARIPVRLNTSTLR